MLRPIYTEPENCQDCYKCIRECPVKAISIENNKASIIEQRCIYCGHCTQICPTGAKKVRDGLTRAKMVLAKNKGRTYMSLAPSYISEFGETSSNALIAAIVKLGFVGVSETALGAELVTKATEDFLTHAPHNFYISSACPVVVDYIRKYAPQLTHNITPIISPMLAHAKMLKQLYGDDIKVIFAGPCIAKKSEADENPNLVDVAITFKDLREWLGMEENYSNEPPKADANAEFIPYHSGVGALYPIDGGMRTGFQRQSKQSCSMSFSDLNTIKNVLDKLEYGGREDTVFLELLACNGGCINGPAKLRTTSLARKRYDVIERSKTGNPTKDFGDMDISTCYVPSSQIEQSEYPEYRITEALAAVGKTTAADELNCSSCGYDSCRDFAIAMLEGRAEDNMCASYMRKIAHDKATVLLQKIPAGVVIVNSDMKVVDMNRHFAEAMGEDTLSVYETLPGMAGASLQGMCSFNGLFRTVITTGEEIKERRVNDGDKAWLLSIFNIQPQRQIFGLLQDLREPTVRKEWMLEKTKEVIRNHMTTVQKVAGLLGENAAYTDSTLRSIIATYAAEESEDKTTGNN